MCRAAEPSLEYPRGSPPDRRSRYLTASDARSRMRGWQSSPDRRVLVVALWARHARRMVANAAGRVVRLAHAAARPGIRARDEASRTSRSTSAASRGSRIAGGQRRAARALPRRPPRLCERSRSVRLRFALRAAVAGPHPLGEERWRDGASPAERAEIQARQDAVQELSGALDLREQLAVDPRRRPQERAPDRLSSGPSRGCRPRALSSAHLDRHHRPGARHPVFFDDRRLVPLAALVTLQFLGFRRCASR